MINFKYLVYHTHNFENPWWCCFFLIAQTCQVIFVEIINVLNILQIDTIKDIVSNFVALSIINDFDEFLYKMYATSNLASKFAGKTLPFENFRKNKTLFSWVDRRKKASTKND